MKQYIPFVISAILLLVFFYQCDKNSELNLKYKANINALSDTVSYFKNRLGTQTASIRTLQADKQTIEDILLKKDSGLKTLSKEFKALRSVYKVESKIYVDTIAIAFDTALDRDTVMIERHGNINSQWYSLGYKITRDSLIISPFSMWTQTTTITGFKRKWFLGKQTLVTDVTNTNPYISVTNIKAAELIVPEPWYRKWYIWLMAGFAGGLIIK